MLTSTDEEKGTSSTSCCCSFASSTRQKPLLYTWLQGRSSIRSAGVKAPRRWHRALEMTQTLNKSRAPCAFWQAWQAKVPLSRVYFKTLHSKSIYARNGRSLLCGDWWSAGIAGTIVTAGLPFGCFRTLLVHKSHWTSETRKCGPQRTFFKSFVLRCDAVHLG